MSETSVTGWCCTDCRMLIANGDTPPELGEEETAAWLAEIEKHSGDCETTLGLTAEEHDCDRPRFGWCECEKREFSWASCDVCGSHLGGSRHAVTFWSKP